MGEGEGNSDQQALCVKELLRILVLYNNKITNLFNSCFFIPEVFEKGLNILCNLLLKNLKLGKFRYSTCCYFFCVKYKR